MTKPESIFVKCDCNCSVLEINYDDYDEGNEQFNVALWVNHPGKPNLSKKERIRWCEHVMKTGNPWSDHTIVTKEDAHRIVKFLTKKLAKYGKDKQNRKH
jgi:hypothetical protein